MIKALSPSDGFASDLMLTMLMQASTSGKLIPKPEDMVFFASDLVDWESVWTDNDDQG